MLNAIIALLLFLGLPMYAIGGVVKEKLEVETLDDTTRVNIYKYVNAWGRLEVRVEAATIPVLGKVNPTLGYGRDTDDDERIDTWFMIDSQKGMIKYITGNDDIWGRNALKTKIFKQYKSSAFAHFSAAYGAVFGTLLMSVSHGWESERIFWVEWMDLEEFGLRLHRARSEGSITSDQYDEGLNVLINGYQQTMDRFEKSITSEYWALGAVDVALWASGGVLVKWLGKGLAFAGRGLAETALVTETKAAVGKMIGKIISNTKGALARLKVLKGTPVKFLAASVFKKKFESHFGSMLFKGALLRNTHRALARSEIALIRARREWKYIAFMAGIQITSESFARADEVVHPNPAIMVQNVLTNESIMKNVGFMSRDAFFMTAATHGIKNKNARYVTCGFIALAHSGITNLWLNKEENPDYARVALDTGWEATIGNAQVQIDLHALKSFEKMAMKNNNPRLKLLGWAVVLVEQAAGFIGYSLATQALEDKDKGPASVHLVPVLVEE